MAYNDKKQLLLYVSGYLAAWATVDAARLTPGGRVSIPLHTDMVHDPYGTFDDVTIQIEGEQRFFHPGA